jgi:hypothetical protein
MLSRALRLATVSLLAGCFAAPSPWAQAQNLEAGKSASQLFAGTCNACHKSPRGLLKTVSAGSLPGFLRQHYTTSSDMASLLSTFLVSNGASDTRYQAKHGPDAKPATEPPDRQGRRSRPSQEAARPDTDVPPPPADVGRQGRNAKRLARPGEAPDAAKPGSDGLVPAQAAIERGPDGRRLTAKQRHGRPVGEESPTAKDEPPKPEPAMDDKAKAETVREDSSKPEGTKPAGEGKSEAAKIEMPKDSNGPGTPPVLRADPVPPVTPAPPSAAAAASSAAAPNAAPEPEAARPSSPAPSEAPPAVTASAPPPPPAVAAGPPAPPISQ